jgi:hypothetical protein
MAASSLQPYFSAVNKYFRDHQLQAIAVNDLLADARRGLEMRQQRLVPADTRMPLPAPAALDIMIDADKLIDNLTWSPSTRPLLERFHACLAICDIYTFLAAQKHASAVSLATSRWTNHCKSIRPQVQRDQRRDTRDKLVMAVPIPATAYTVHKFGYFLVSRDRATDLYFSHFFGMLSHTYLQLIPHQQQRAKCPRHQHRLPNRRHGSNP